LGTKTVYALSTGLFQRALAIEANTDNCALLRCNLWLNKLCEKTKVFETALSDTDGLLEMEISLENRGDHRVAGTCAGDDLYAESGRRRVSVESMRLDSLLMKDSFAMNPHSLMWIDTQGYEGQVLQGAARYIGGDALRFVVLEFWPYGINRVGGRNALFDVLGRARQIFDLSAAEWHERKPLDCEDLVALYECLLSESHNQLAPHVDLLCVF
jgi:FkbM family methyltransferase